LTVGQLDSWTVGQFDSLGFELELDSLGFELDSWTVGQFESLTALVLSWSWTVGQLDSLGFELELDSLGFELGIVFGRWRSAGCQP
jgi:hypothetical protein